MTLVRGSMSAAYTGASHGGSMPNEYDWSGPDVDLTPCYLPDKLMSVKGMSEVVRTVYYPVGARPADLKCCVREDMGVLIAHLANGHTRSYGCKHAYINSELRMVVIGRFKADEVRCKWRTAKH